MEKYQIYLDSFKSPLRVESVLCMSRRSKDSLKKPKPDIRRLKLRMKTLTKGSQPIVFFEGKNNQLLPTKSQFLYQACILAFLQNYALKSAYIYVQKERKHS